MALPVDIGGINNAGIPTGTITTAGTYSIGGSTASSAIFSGLITSGQSFSVTQVAGGTLDITGGINGITASTKTVQFNDAGAVNVTTNGIGSTAGILNLTKTNTGTLTLAAATTYGGTTTIGTALVGTPASATANGGVLSAAAAGALGVTSGITVNNGGTLRLSAVTANPTASDASDRISDFASITLGTTGANGGIGGTIQRGAFVSEGSGSSAGMGVLTLVSTSTLDFGSTTAGQLGTLSFASFAPGSTPFTLNIINYVSHGPTAGTDNIDDRLIVGGDQTNSLNDYLFNGIAGASEINLNNGYYEIVPRPVPEPSTVAAILCLGAFGVYLRRRTSARRA